MTYLNEAFSKLRALDEDRIAFSKHPLLACYPKELKNKLPKEIGKPDNFYRGTLVLIDNKPHSVASVCIQSLPPEELDVNYIGTELLIAFYTENQKATIRLTMKELLEKIDNGSFEFWDEGTDFENLVNLYKEAFGAVELEIEREEERKLSPAERNRKRGESFTADIDAKCDSWYTLSSEEKEYCLNWFKEHLTNVSIGCNNYFVNAIMRDFPHSKMVQAGPNQGNGFNSYDDYETKRAVQIVIAMSDIENCPISEIRFNNMAATGEYSDTGFAYILYQNKLWKKNGKSDWI